MAIVETEATLIEKRDLSPDTRLFIFKAEEQIDFIPGQFVMMNIDKNDKALTRAFSIASTQNKENTLEFCIKIIPNGAVTSRLDKFPLQEKVSLKGALGQFVIKSKEREIVFIACGTGIAPIRAMLQQLAKENTSKPLWLFFRFKNQHDYLFEEELQQLKQTLPNLKIISSISNHNGDKNHEKERIQNCISKYITDPREKDVYLCGSPEMVKDTIEKLGQLGFDTTHIYKEAW